jgi:hypothetical protein
MNPFATELTSSFALFLFLSGAQIASAFYEPNLGRWINRDPISDVGFQSLRAGHARAAKPAKRDISELYQFVGNSPVSEWDYLGLDNPGCDFPLAPAGDIQRLCQLRCCSVHDQCFANRPGGKPCKALTSWPVVWCPWSYCGRCNRDAANCLAKCSLDNTDEGPEDVDPYFCPNGPNRGTTYSTWGEIPSSCWESGTRPSRPEGYP